jgi:hypothetical protein
VDVINNNNQQRKETAMKVREVIAMLEKNHKPDEDIVLAYWTKDLFQGYYEDGSLTDEVWRDVVAQLDSHDLSDYTNVSAWNDITNRIDEYINIEKGNK